MVIFFEWHRTAVEQKSSSGFPMTGEDTGLGALASPLVGYLGKVQERAASHENCPWCASKGLSYALRSYCINLQESIILCTNPQCLFPLVSRSLEDVLASLDPVESTIGNKRKTPLALENEESNKHPPKRLRSSDNDKLEVVNTVSNGQHVTAKTDGDNVNGYHLDFACPAAETTGRESLQDKDAAVPEDFSHPTCTDSAEHLQSSSKDSLPTLDEPVFAPHCGALSVLEAEDDCSQVNPEVLNIPSSLTSSQSGQMAWTEQKSLTADIITYENTSSIITESEELVSVPSHLFWRNSDNLCWLDSLLVALVNCKSLRKSKPKEEPQRSSIWQLMRGYEDICAAIQAHQQTDRDGIVRVPNHVLQKADADLQNLRMSVFKLLQPKLHCKLGQRETPVFAMPLLLMMDSWVEPLFQSAFLWDFKCSECKFATKERVVKTLPTFTNIVPEWRPLHAVHLAPCNMCCKKNQRRTMMLESVPPVFVLHFVEGLPDNEVRTYTFNFKGKRYSVTTVIQYNHQLKHFVTWIYNSDGSWLEYDDLKHPECKLHKKLPVPAQEMHVVIWEIEEDKEPCACSPSSTCTDSQPSKTEINPSLSEKEVTGDELLACTPDQSLVMSHNDTDIVSAFSVSKDNSNIMDTTGPAGVDTSIGSTTLLDTFEGLSHNDIITLTLVELKPDSETQPLNDSRENQDLRVPNKNEILDPTPDSSSAVISSEMSHSPVVEHASTSNSSDPESNDGSSSDPTFVPCGRKGRGREIAKGKTISRQGKKAASAKAAPHISPPKTSEPSNVIPNKPVCAGLQHSTPPFETTQQTSPVSSTENSHLSTSHISPTNPTSLDQNARWSFLLSKHPLGKPVAKPTPNHSPTLVTQVKLTPPTHSTPNPVRRQQTPGGLFSKPQLRTEDTVGLPLKAAEMYCAFGAKSSNTQSPLPSPVPFSGNAKLIQPVMSHHQKSLMNTTVLSGTTLPAPEEKRLPEISLKKHISQSSKVPPGLSKTEALRYKLIKKLKAKKKALAKLNKLLGEPGETTLQPDSTDLNSPNTVTSSTYDSSTCEDFLSDLLSPATTASNLSPDSTSLQEILGSGQAVVDPLDCGINAAGAASQTDTYMLGPSPENFLDEFLSQAVAERPTEMESEALSALEMFM